MPDEAAETRLASSDRSTSSHHLSHGIFGNELSASRIRVSSLDVTTRTTNASRPSWTGPISPGFIGSLDRHFLNVSGSTRSGSGDVAGIDELTSRERLSLTGPTKAPDVVPLLLDMALNF